MDAEFTAWFTREILAHEAALTRLLSQSWLRPSEVPDVRHDVYIKVLEAAELQRPASPKAFLFATAKNLLIDRARRSRVVPIDLLQDIDASHLLRDEISPERVAGGLQHLLRLTKALDKLPGRCRDVVWLRKIEDVTQKEIARRLGIAEATVEAHLVRGMRMLTHLFYDEESDDHGGTTRKVERGSGHGR